MRKRVGWYVAREMWRNGKDTAFIAEYFGRDEAHIYNGLLVHGGGKHKRIVDHSPPVCHFNIVKHKARLP